MTALHTPPTTQKKKIVYLINLLKECQNDMVELSTTFREKMGYECQLIKEPSSYDTLNEEIKKKIKEIATIIVIYCGYGFNDCLVLGKNCVEYRDFCEMFNPLGNNQVAVFSNCLIREGEKSKDGYSYPKKKTTSGMGPRNTSHSVFKVIDRSIDGSLFSKSFLGTINEFGNSKKDNITFLNIRHHCLTFINKRMENQKDMENEIENKFTNQVYLYKITESDFFFTKDRVINI